MATATFKWYGNTIAKAFSKEIDWINDTIKIMICTSSYVPDQDAHIYKSSVTSEVSGAGYTAGGATLAGKVLTYTSATNVTKFSANTVTFSNATFTGRVAVVYDDTPATDGTKPLIGYAVFDADVPCSGGTFTVTFDGAGILTVTVS